ncbi:hypothetical protein ENUP19_0170G0011 [Entamoeba nuttalli]|uniref:UDP-galactose transporter n=1 Tax=Entamoeba nuttalli TaxID=412467 RepID=A0ABQ0DMB9_9EUKA
MTISTIQSYKTNVNILITAICLVVSFLSVGFFAEYLTKHQFGKDKTLFTATSALVFLQASFSTLGAYVLIKISKQHFDIKNIPHKRFVIQSQAYCGAMFFSNKSLLYIDYPTQIITKFFKPITVMLFSIFYTKKYEIRQIIFSIITFSGIAMFMYDKFAKLDTSKYSDFSFLFGLILIVTSLLCDGVASAEEDIIAHDYQVPLFYTMMYANLYAIPLFAIISIVTGDLQQMISIISQDIEFLLIIICYVFCSVCGQYFIYRLITLANSLLLVAVTNTRKIVTMIISVIVFKHPITKLQILATFIVFGTLFIDIMTRKPRQPQQQQSSENTKEE